MTLVEFLEARIAEREKSATPRTVCVSGGRPAPEVPNCIGPRGTGDCPEQWTLEGHGKPSRWWMAPEVQAAIRVHEMTHATAEQRFILAECASKRAILELHYAAATYQRKNGRKLKTPTGWYCDECQWDEGPAGEYPCTTLRLLALPYIDHPDFDEAWLL